MMVWEGGAWLFVAGDGGKERYCHRDGEVG